MVLVTQCEGPPRLLKAGGPISTCSPSGSEGWVGFEERAGTKGLWELELLESCGFDQASKDK